MTLQQLQDRMALASREIREQVAIEAKGTALTAEARAKMLATERLKVRTGRLRGSIAGLVEDEPAAFLVRLRSDVPYARVQEEGGTIRPRRGKFLAIPNSLTGAGVSRYASPRDVPGLRFVPTRGGASGMLVRDVGRGKSARIEVMFWLVRQVTLKPKRYLADGLDQAAQGLTDRLARRVVAALAGA